LGSVSWFFDVTLASISLISDSKKFLHYYKDRCVSSLVGLKAAHAECMRRLSLPNS
jgi:hypothetical protein